jgi:CheY-like chemotaxis protein
VQDRSDIRADVEEIRSAGERAARLTSQLLAFSRKQMVSPRVLNLNDVLLDLKKMLGRVLGEDVHLVFTTASELKAITADPGQLEQVLLNLAVNARDAMPHGGTLSLTTANVTLDGHFSRTHPGAGPGDYVCLTVADTGSGMSHEVLSRIFEPFFTTKGSRGTGLGLATVYGIVKQSGGYIYVESVPGAGTTFSLYFPAVTDTVEAGIEPLRATSGKGITATVLLAEDDPAIRELIGRTLQQRGYTVLPAPQAREALAIAAEYPEEIHLLVTDIVMPDLNGRELAEQLRQFRPEVKVLYVTGYFAHPAAEISELSASERFLEKPFTAEALLEIIDDHLSGMTPHV